MSRDENLLNEIKQDIIYNIDLIVSRIYDLVTDDHNPLKSIQSTSEAIYFVISSIHSEHSLKDELDRFLGKEPMPPPFINTDGSTEVYNEIDLRSICESISIANDIFTTDYNYVYKKGHNIQRIPKSIINIIENYEIYRKLAIRADKNDTKDIKILITWLTKISLVGIVRWLGLSNKPYMLDSEIEKYCKKFLKNLESLTDVYFNRKIMRDPDDNGHAIFDVNSSYKSKNIKFIKRS